MKNHVPNGTHTHTHIQFQTHWNSKSITSHQLYLQLWNYANQQHTQFDEFVCLNESSEFIFGCFLFGFLFRPNWNFSLWLCLNMSTFHNIFFLAMHSTNSRWKWMKSDFNRIGMNFLFVVEFQWIRKKIILHVQWMESMYGLHVSTCNSIGIRLFPSVLSSRVSRIFFFTRCYVWSECDYGTTI